MKIVIATDKFKGSATSAQVAQAMSNAVMSVCPQAQVVSVPVADGGEGTIEAFAAALPHCHTVQCEAAAPLPQLDPVTATYLLDEEHQTAIIELAAASGLTLVPQHMRNPLKTSTLGTGVMILDAIGHGARHIVLGIGGSATNDCATGILAALGFEFLDNDQCHVFPCGENLGRIATVDASGVSQAVKDCQFTIICDVDNPLYGENGAAHIYGPQKGASPSQVEQLDQGVKHFATLMPDGVANTPGAGAAGGVGGGLMAFLNATLTPGIDAVLNCLNFDETIHDADLIITGEGRIDGQTAMGKTAGGVLRAGKRNGIPVVAICGALANDARIDVMEFDGIFPVVQQPCTLEQAMDTTRCLHNVEATVKQIMKLFVSQHKPL